VPYFVIGLMSGTSLDGLDLAFCEFEKKDNRWSYLIHQAETYPYTREWKERLSSIESAAAVDFAMTDASYGHLLGKCAKDFIENHQIRPDFIASHGHTIFHQPQNRFTTQIGKGSAIAAETGLPVVSDFRSADVALGGQGAPLVPIGDRLLFSDYEYCLNLGGFANISFEKNGNRIAFDVCPANIVLNSIAEKAGAYYDDGGEMARKGIILPGLLEKLNLLPYYTRQAPKSLGKEWALAEIQPLIDVALTLPASDSLLCDLLATFCEHIAIQVARIVCPMPGEKILITGGGAFNKFLIERIAQHIRAEIELPDNKTINFKEALIFAFLAVLRWRNEVNCLMSVTGAARDSVGGAIY